MLKKMYMKLVENRIGDKIRSGRGERMEEFGELMCAIDEELGHCIQKFRNATSGHDARIFVSEYEELMMRKSQLIADICIKHGSCDKAEKNRVALRNVEGKTQKESRQSKHMAVAALVISVIAMLIQLLHQ